MTPPAPQPAPPQPAPRTPATPSPAYPYGAYPYYGPPYYPYPYPAAAQGKPAALPRSPSERAGKPWAARVRNLVLAVVAILVTAAAIAAAVGAAASAQSAPAPASEGLRQVYSQSLVSDSSNWSLDQGCALQYGGLLADGTSDASSTDPALCKFIPSTQQNLLSQGFQASVVMAPSGDVPGLEQGGIALDTGGSTSVFDFTQQGQFVFSVTGAQTLPVTGSTIAWHTDPSLANTITLDYSATNSVLHLYVNGQSTYSHSVTLEQGNALGLFAPNQSQALFTNFTLYSAA